jgi:hypothetical protein
MEAEQLKGQLDGLVLAVIAEEPKHVVRAVELLPVAAGGFGTADTVSLLISAMPRRWRSSPWARAAQGSSVGGPRLDLRDEASVPVRRAGVGLGAGVVTILAFPPSEDIGDPRRHSQREVVGIVTNISGVIAAVIFFVIDVATGGASDRRSAWP